MPIHLQVKQCGATLLYWKEVQPGAWWVIQRTCGSVEEWDEETEPSIDSVPASQIQLWEECYESIVLCKSQTPHWPYLCRRQLAIHVLKVAFNVPLFIQLLFLVDLHFHTAHGFKVVHPKNHWNIFHYKILKPFTSVSNRGANCFYLLETINKEIIIQFLNCIWLCLRPLFWF